MRFNVRSATKTDDNLNDAGSISFPPLDGENWTFEVDISGMAGTAVKEFLGLAVNYGQSGKANY
jgi:hypothetical protein